MNDGDPGACLRMAAAVEPPMPVERPSLWWGALQPALRCRVQVDMTAAESAGRPHLVTGPLQHREPVKAVRGCTGHGSPPACRLDRGPHHRIYVSGGGEGDMRASCLVRAGRPAETGGVARPRLEELLQR